MAKISREKFKGIVKECLMEILSEGLSSDTLVEAPVNRKRVKRKSSPPRRPALDHITFGKKVDETVNNLTDDPLMASIFADTATGTLQEQLDAESYGPSVSQGDFAARTADAADPTDMFGEAAGNWAALAFSEKKQL